MRVLGRHSSEAILGEALAHARALDRPAPRSLSETVGLRAEIQARPVEPARGTALVEERIGALFAATLKRAARLDLAAGEGPAAGVEAAAASGSPGR